MSAVYTVAIVTVSDTAFNQGKEFDTAGPALLEVVGGHQSYKAAEHVIVPDDELKIQEQVARLAGGEGDSRVDWIIVTGGTGWGARDVTPQALRPLLEPLPTLQQYLCNAFLEKTPMSILSRPTVGLCGRTLVVATSGSKKACMETWEALTSPAMNKALPHGFKLLRGGSGSDLHPPRQTIRQESTSAGENDHSHSCDHERHNHSHQHEHKAGERLSKDPSQAVSRRHRHSPFPLISLDAALQIVHDTTKPLPTETVTVSPGLRNYVLAEPVVAQHDLPRTMTTNVDGYALAVPGTSKADIGIYKVVKAEAGAGERTCVRVNTGGPLPGWCNTVVMVEDTEVHEAANEEELAIKILEPVASGSNVRKQGSDAAKGDKVLDAGKVIGSGGGEIGLLGFVGQRTVDVIRRPRIGLLSTGNELVDLNAASTSESPSSWSGIVDTNRPSLQATLEGLGYEVLDLGIAPDQMEKQQKVTERGLRETDILITTGGTSMGEADLLKPIIEHTFNGTIHFGRVAMKPGKPTTFASIPFEGVQKPIFGLPGNPASALVTLYVFVLPALRRLGGWPAKRCSLPEIDVTIDCEMSLDTREEYHRAIVSIQSDGQLIARSTGGQRSSRVASLSGANALIRLPMRDSERTALRKGEKGRAMIIGEILTD